MRVCAVREENSKSVAVPGEGSGIRYPVFGIRYLVFSPVLEQVRVRVRPIIDAILLRSLVLDHRRLDE
jgi:hypothetical protein